MYGFFLKDTKQNSPQIYIKLTRFEDNDCRKLPLNQTLLKTSGWAIFQNCFFLFASEKKKRRQPLNRKRARTLKKFSLFIIYNLILTLIFHYATPILFSSVCVRRKTDEEQRQMECQEKKECPFVAREATNLITPIFMSFCNPITHIPRLFVIVSRLKK